MHRRIAWSRWALLSLMVLAMAATVRYRLVGTDGRAWQSAINNDGKGYYEYLRAPLVEGRLDGRHGEPWMFAEAGEGRVIKYFAGTALVQAPYVLAAHAYTLLLARGPEDGYSLHYHLAITISAWVSLLLGLWCTRRLLIDMGQGDRTVALVLVAITLGTGLLVQAVVHPGMSHVHSFAAVAALYLAVRRAMARSDGRRWLLVGLLTGMVFILRPVDLLALGALPLIATGIPWRPGSMRPPHGAALLLGAAIPLLVQAALWYVQCGEWVVRPYAGEGFHWDRPAVLHQLFSARNGLLFYWPVLLLALPGMLLLAVRRPRRSLPYLLSLAAFAYVTSAWWNWSYGDAFGQRPYVDVLAMLAVPMAATLASGPRAYRRLLLLALLVPGTALNLFQSWQYATGVLVPARLYGATYAHVFLRTTPGLGRQLGGMRELPPYAPNGMRTLLRVNSPWKPDSTHTMSFVLPGSDAGAGWWHLDLAITRTLLPNADASGTSVLLHAPGWPGAGVRFGLEHVPGSGPGTRRWENALHLPPQRAGDTLRVQLRPAEGMRIDSLSLQVRVPR